MQMLAHVQLALQPGAQRIAELIQPLGRREGRGAGLVAVRLRLGQERRDLDGIDLAAPDAGSARHGIVHARRPASGGQCRSTGWR